MKGAQDGLFFPVCVLEQGQRLIAMASHHNLVKNLGPAPTTPDLDLAGLTPCHRHGAAADAMGEIAREKDRACVRLDRSRAAALAARKFR
jgi:hypothetical protein